MEVCQNRPPKMLTEGVEATCNKCGKSLYSETWKTNSEGEVMYYFTGSYKRKCDSEGNPVGAVIPFCECK